MKSVIKEKPKNKKSSKTEPKVDTYKVVADILNKKVLNLQNQLAKAKADYKQLENKSIQTERTYSQWIALQSTSIDTLTQENDRLKNDLSSRDIIIQSLLSQLNCLHPPKIMENGVISHNVTNGLNLSIDQQLQHSPQIFSPGKPQNERVNDDQLNNKNDVSNDLSTSQQSTVFKDSLM